MILKEINFTGEIIFDLLLANGNSSNRFIRTKIKNSEIDRTSMKVLKDIDNSIVIKSRDFYRKNKDLLDNSILSDKEKILLK